MSEGGQRETWEDWWPVGWPLPGVISRAELLDQLATRGVAVDERLLRHWEHRGALPRGVRRSHNGQVQAVYPLWMADLVSALQGWRGSQPLRSIVPVARRFFVDFARIYVYPETAVWMKDWEPPEYVRAALAQFAREEGPETEGVIAIEVRARDGATRRWSSSWLDLPASTNGPQGPIDTNLSR